MLVKWMMILYVSFTFASCHDSSPEVKQEDLKREIKNLNAGIIKEARSLVIPGDLILRTGIDFSSEQIKDISKTDKTYSHAGIATIENGQIFIYHIEPDYQLLKDKVRKEELDSFCNPDKNIGFGIARYSLEEKERRKFLSYLERQYKKKIPFDIQFNLSSDDSMYCSEMIRKGLIYATGNKLVLPTDRMNDKSKYKLIKQYFKLKEDQFVNREIIPMDRLFLNPHCRIVKRFVFDKK